MITNDLEAIKRRAEAARFDPGVTMRLLSAEDVPALVAECEELRGQNALLSENYSRLREDLEGRPTAAGSEQLRARAEAAEKENRDLKSGYLYAPYIARAEAAEAKLDDALPLITERTKNDAMARLGEVYRHPLGEQGASCGVVEVNRARRELEYFIARAEAAEKENRDLKSGYLYAPYIARAEAAEAEAEALRASIGRVEADLAMLTERVPLASDVEDAIKAGLEARAEMAEAKLAALDDAAKGVVRMMAQRDEAEAKLADQEYDRSNAVRELGEVKARAVALEFALATDSGRELLERVEKAKQALAMAQVALWGGVGPRGTTDEARVAVAEALALLGS